MSTPRLTTPTSRLLKSPALFITLWLIAVFIGYSTLLSYQSEPGRENPVPEKWPETSAVNPSKKPFTVLIFLHPHCPCSKASLRELERVLARRHRNTSAYAIFCTLPEAPQDWEQGALWQQAHKIEHLKVLLDNNQQEQSSFHVTTSGQVLLYDYKGKLRYKGGITPARGHEGSNPGLRTLESLLQNQISDQKSIQKLSYPVYGCGLSTPTLSSKPTQESHQACESCTQSAP